MGEISINAALVQGLTAANLGMAISPEGKDSRPPTTATPWAAWFNIPADTEVASLGAGGMDETVGIFQVNINYPQNSGTAGPLTSVQKLRDYFIAGRRLVYDGQCVKVERVTRNNLRPVDGWQQINVSIYYTANTIRPEV